MKNGSWWGIGVAALAVCAAPSAAWAAEKVTAVEAVKGDYEDNLGMTPEQKEKTRQIRSAYREKKREIRETLAARTESLRQELDAQVPDRARVDALAAEIKSLNGQLIDSRVELIFKLRETYTPDQLRMIREMPPKPAADKPLKRPLKSNTKKSKKTTKGN